MVQQLSSARRKSGDPLLCIHPSFRSLRLHICPFTVARLLLLVYLPWRGREDEAAGLVCPPESTRSSRPGPCYTANPNWQGGSSGKHLAIPLPPAAPVKFRFYKRWSGRVERAGSRKRATWLWGTWSDPYTRGAPAFLFKGPVLSCSPSAEIYRDSYCIQHFTLVNAGPTIFPIEHLLILKCYECHPEMLHSPPSNPARMKCT